MNIGTVVFLIAVGVFLAVILNVAQRSRNKQSGREKRQQDDCVEDPNTVDETEDVLFTGILLGSMLNNDSQADSSADTDSGGFDGGSGGGFDGGGFDGGGGFE